MQTATAKSEQFDSTKAELLDVSDGARRWRIKEVPSRMNRHAKKRLRKQNERYLFEDVALPAILEWLQKRSRVSNEDFMDFIHEGEFRCFPHTLDGCLYIVRSTYGDEIERDQVEMVGWKLDEQARADIEAWEEEVGEPLDSHAVASMSVWVREVV